MRDKFYIFTIKFNSVTLWNSKLNLFCKVFVCLITLIFVNKCTEKELVVYRYFALFYFVHSVFVLHTSYNFHKI